MEKICKIGVVGFGLRGEYMVKNFAQFQIPGKVVAIVDPQVDMVKTRLATLHIPLDSVKFYENIPSMMEQETLDGVMVTSSCSSHAELASQLMPYAVPLFLEKPVVISEKQWQQLSQAKEIYDPHVLVSFPLRGSPLCQAVKARIDSGVLGKISQVQMINNVNYGGVYYHSWYRDESLTGGLFMQKATHDLDLLQYLMGQLPNQISAMESKNIFCGDKEPGITCPNCQEYTTCPESSRQIRHQYQENVDGEGCAFAKDTGNHDSATITMAFPSGFHAVYSQNFVARKGAGQRSMRIIGYDATLYFDFVTSKIEIFHHHKGLVETLVVDDYGLHHFGGDKVLAENFVEMMQGKNTTLADLQSGLDSALTCLRAKKSAETHMFVER